MTPGDGDDGVFSGGAFITKEGRPALIYVGLGIGNSIAFGVDDDLIEWKKASWNPIVPNPQKGTPEYELYSSFDPCCWLDGDSYYAIFGGRVAALFKSPDLKKWEYFSPLIADRKWTAGAEKWKNQGAWVDEVCPDFFPPGDRHVLLFLNHSLGAGYVIGQWKDEKFLPKRQGMMNWTGGRCFAPESLVDDRGQRIMWAWVCEARSRRAMDEAGWSGMMTLPRVLPLAEDRSLRIEPVEEIERLRIHPRRHEDIRLTADAEVPMKDVAGDCLEIALEIDPSNAKQVGLKIHRSPGGEEETVIAYDTSEKTLIVDVTKSTLNKDVQYNWPNPFVSEYPKHPVDGDQRRGDARVQAAPFELQKGKTLKLRVFLDRSILEVFANGQQCVTQPIYPDRDDSEGVVLFSRGGNATVKSLEAWEMAATNPW